MEKMLRIDILKRTESNEPDHVELTKAIAALEEVLTLVVIGCFIHCRISFLILLIV